MRPTLLPAPERVGRGLRHWLVWFAVDVGLERRLRLIMLPLEGPDGR